MNGHWYPPSGSTKEPNPRQLFPKPDPDAEQKPRPWQPVRPSGNVSGPAACGVTSEMSPEPSLPEQNRGGTVTSELTSHPALESRRRQQEARWEAIESELAWCWDWKKIATGWEQLMDMDQKFFPQRFRDHVAEAMEGARYIPFYALEVILRYCLHQPPAIRQMYHDRWQEKLHHERWMNWQQRMVIEEYLANCQRFMDQQGTESGSSGISWQVFGPLSRREWHGPSMANTLSVNETIRFRELPKDPGEGED